MSWVEGFLAALVISTVTTPVGVSGAVFLLPIQLNLLHVPNPAVTPTNLLYARKHFTRASPDGGFAIHGR